MTMWDPEGDPNKYPIRWHNICHKQPGLYELQTYETEAEMRREQKRFAAFRACLRHHPDHPSAKFLAVRRIRILDRPDVSAAGGGTLMAEVRWSDNHIVELTKALYPSQAR